PPPHAAPAPGPAPPSRAAAPRRGRQRQQTGHGPERERKAEEARERRSGAPGGRGQRLIGTRSGFPAIFGDVARRGDQAAQDAAGEIALMKSGIHFGAKDAADAAVGENAFEPVADLEPD